MQKKKKGTQGHMKRSVSKLLSNITYIYSLHLKNAFGRRNYKLYVNIHALQIT